MARGPRPYDGSTVFSRKYGFTYEEFAALILTQKNCCAYCGEPFSDDRYDRNNIAVPDHDHDSGTLRGAVHSVL